MADRIVHAIEREFVRAWTHAQNMDQVSLFIVSAWYAGEGAVLAILGHAALSDDAYFLCEFCRWLRTNGSE